MKCDGCGVPMEEKDIALAYNIGAGPEYYCAQCKPLPSTAEQVEAEIKAVMGKLDGDN